jgi:hypothetical protein
MEVLYVLSHFGFRLETVEDDVNAVQRVDHAESAIGIVTDSQHGYAFVVGHGDSTGLHEELRQCAPRDENSVVCSSASQRKGRSGSITRGQVGDRAALWGGHPNQVSPFPSAWVANAYGIIVDLMMH